MYKCEKCINKNRRNICKICHEGDCFENYFITNADRIRQMDDEELAKFIGATKCNTLFVECGYPTCESMNGKYCSGFQRKADKDILQWLKKTSEDRV